MSELTVRSLSAQDKESWEKFVENSNNGTIFHRLKFLAYHGQRFRSNERHGVILDGKKIFGVFPLAVFEVDGQRIARSPYGASYGGPVFAEALNYEQSAAVVESLVQYFKSLKVSEAVMTLPPRCCERVYSETFQLVLLNAGFETVNRDITSVVSLSAGILETGLFAAKQKETGRKARKAREAKIETVHRAPVEDFWTVLEKTFEKFDFPPTHTREEFAQLHKSFPKEIYCDVAFLDGKPVAGIGFIHVNALTALTFYLCGDPTHQKTQALSLLIEEALRRSQKEGFRYLDFGTSSMQMKPRENLFRFKESFGAIGLFRTTYRLKL